MIDQKALFLYPQNQRIIFRNQDCMYVRPHEALLPYISNYTLTFPTKQAISENYTVIPHGCGTLVCGFKDHQIDNQLLGPMTVAANVGEEAVTFNQIFIVEFQPAGLHAFLSLKQNELADRHFSFQLLHAKLNQVLMELLEEAESVEELLAGVDRLFVHALLKDCPPELATSRKMIVQQSGNISLKKLSNEVFYSERHLTRLFNEYLGMSTKMFARLVRVNQTIRLLNRRQGVITKVLEPAGYYDFSHFNRDFKLVTGITPQAYQRKMSDFYSEIAKF